VGSGNHANFCRSEGRTGTTKLQSHYQLFAANKVRVRRPDGSEELVRERIYLAAWARKELGTIDPPADGTPSLNPRKEDGGTADDHRRVEDFIAERCDCCDEERECTCFPYWIGILQNIEGSYAYWGTGSMSTATRSFSMSPHDPVKICKQCQSDYFGRRKVPRRLAEKKETVGMFHLAQNTEHRAMVLAAERVMRREFADTRKVKCWGLKGERYAKGDVIVFTPYQAACMAPQRDVWGAGGTNVTAARGFLRGLVYMYCTQEEALAYWAKAHAERHRTSQPPPTPGD
jgi:hypothetical protein